MPDVQIAVVVGGGQLLHGDVAALGVVPAGEHFLDLDVGVLLHHLAEPGVAILVGGDAFDAADVQHAALATELVGEPLGAETAVLDLVVGGDEGAFGSDRLVDGDDDDALGDGLFDDRVELLAVGRVDDDRVDALGDEVLQVLDLLRRTAVARDGDDLADLTTGERLGLDRADHLLPPAVAGERVADADHEVAAAAAVRRAGRFGACRFGAGWFGAGGSVVSVEAVAPTPVTKVRASAESPAMPSGSAGAAGRRWTLWSCGSPPLFTPGVSWLAPADQENGADGASPRAAGLPRP